MKMKKILSMGALGLTIAMSTSIGVLAAEKPDNATIKSDIVSRVISNKNILNYTLNETTTVKNVLDKEKLTQLEAELEEYSGESYTTLTYVLGLVDINKSFLVNATNIVSSLNNNENGYTFDSLVSETRKLAVTLRKIDNSDATEKLKIEQDIQSLVKSASSSLNAVFGKNKDGDATITIMQNNQIILQLNSANAYTVSDSLGDDGSKLEDLIGLFGLLN